MDLTKNIKAVREARGVKQADLARSLGIDPTNYPKLEKRGNRLTYEQLEKIAVALGVSVMEILNLGAMATGQSYERVQELERENQKLREDLERANRVLDSFVALVNLGNGVKEERVKELASSIEQDIPTVLEQAIKRVIEKRE